MLQHICVYIISLKIYSAIQPSDALIDKIEMVTKQSEASTIGIIFCLKTTWKLLYSISAGGWTKQTASLVYIGCDAVVMPRDDTELRTAVPRFGRKNFLRTGFSPQYYGWNGSTYLGCSLLARGIPPAIFDPYGGLPPGLHGLFWPNGSGQTSKYTYVFLELTDHHLD